jgi:hypothetical protein
MIRRWLLTVTALVTIAPVWLLVPCTPLGTAEPITIRAAFERAVATFEPVKLSVSVTGHASRLEAPAQVFASVALPPSMVFINGVLRWDGTVAPGETRAFESTVAIVLEGDSNVFLTASYSYKDSLGNQRSGGVGDSTRIRATAAGGELNPAPKPQVIRAYSPTDGAHEDDVLLNRGQQPRLIVFPRRDRGRAYSVLESLGLAPPWEPPIQTSGEPPQVKEAVPTRATPTAREVSTYGRVVAQFFRDDDASVVALYDRRRPTTGFHIALVSVNSGAHALDIVGRALQPDDNVYVVDYVATGPRPNWPVEVREVSPYSVYPLGWAPGERFKELVFRINNEIVGRHLVYREPNGLLHAEVPVEFAPKVPE